MFDAESRAQRLKIRFALGAAGLFLVSLVMSCQELRYMTSGRSVDARIVADQIDISRTRSGRRVEQRVIRYSFSDGDKHRSEYAKVPHEYVAPAGPTVRVQYIPNREMLSRLEGQHHYGWVGVFFGSLAALGVAAYLLSREQ